MTEAVGSECEMTEAVGQMTESVRRGGQICETVTPNLMLLGGDLVTLRDGRQERSQHVAHGGADVTAS